MFHGHCQNHKKRAATKNPIHSASNMTPPKVMLIGAGNPAATGVGEQFMDGMLADYPCELVERFALNHQATNESVPWRGSKCHTRNYTHSNLPFLATLANRKFRKSRVSALATELIELTQRHQSDVIWAFANSIPMFYLIDEIRKQNALPYVVSSWDSPEYLVSKSGLDRVSARNALQTFAGVLKSARQVVTICPQMSTIYRDQYGIESVPMPFCPAAENWLPIAERPSATSDQQEQPSRPIKIIFAGSLYATREWNHFLAAIETHHQSGDLPRFEVTCLGSQGRKADRKDWVRYEPTKPQAEAAAIINQSDIAYLPYWMDKKHDFFTRTAFPSKLPFYVASGTPVFFHGPRESTPADFIRKYSVGTNCHSLAADSIIETLISAVSGPARQTFVEARQQVFMEDLDPNRGGQIFARTVKEAANNKV